MVDSGATVHVVFKRDLNSPELETMRTSRSPTTVMTANGEVQTREEATVARGMGSTKPAVNRRRRTRKGPDPTCVQTTFLLRGGTRRETRAN